MKQNRVLSALLSAAVAASLIVLPVQAADRSQAMLAGMTTEEKVSQMIMPAFRYVTDSQGRRQSLEEITPAVAASLRRHGYAGVVLFAQNAGETEKNVRLIDAMQKANASVTGRPQLMMAVDQEGGYVTRLGQGTQMPGNMAMGAAGDPSVTASEADVIGRELQTIGYHFNFAPVVDVNNNPANPVIGVRSFSDDPQTAAAQGAAYMKALQETGTISCLKHFPGHGDTDTDSHTGLPCVGKTYEELKAFELIPFQACVDAGAEAVMTAHIQYPNIERKTYVSKLTGEEITLPATLSGTILTEILRGDMGFEGVVITDALNMDAIDKHFERLDTAKLAIEAGADILLMPVDTSTEEGILDLDRYIADVTKLVEDGTISRDKVDAAVLRILTLKEGKGLLDAYDGSDLEQRAAAAASFVGSPANHETEWRIAKKAVTLVKNDNNLLPLTREGQKVAVLTAYDNETLAMDYAVGRLRDEGKLAKDTAVSIHSIQGMTFDQVKPLLEGQDHVVVVSEITRAAALDPAQTAGAYSALLDRIIETVHSGGGTVTVLSAQLPYDAARYPTADAILIAWSSKGMSEDPRNPANGAVKQYGPNMPAALYLALSPDESPAGKLPVNLPALDDGYRYSDRILYPRGYGLTYETARQASGHGGGNAGQPGASRCPDPENCPLNGFSDTNRDAWYHDGVHYVLETGIMNGVAGDRFAPGTPASRAMIVTMLWRMEGEPLSDDAVTFSDVPAGSWYAGAVRWAAAAGIVSGYSAERFGPEDSVTREQLAAILYRFAQSKHRDVSVGEDADILSYTDAFSVSQWAMEAMRWAWGAGLLNGRTADTLAPGENAGRAEVAAVLLRYDGLN